MGPPAGNNYNRQATTSRSIPAGGYDSAPHQMGLPPGNNYNRQGFGPTTSRSIPAGGYDSVPQHMGPPHGSNYNLPTSRGLGQNQPYPDSTTYHGALGHGGYGGVAHNYDEEGGARGFEGYVHQPEEGDEEVEEEPDPEAEYEERENPGEDNEEEEQGYNAQGNEDYEAGGQEEEEEDTGGYQEQAPSRWRW